MRRLSLLLSLPFVAACSTVNSPEPSLAPRAAEAIDPRMPISAEEAPGPVDPALAGQLTALVAEVRAAVPAFEARQAEASRLAAAAGPAASESWIAAEQALSRLIRQHGVTTRVAADIDALASSRLDVQGWISPADRQAITAAGAEVGAISAGQSEAIARLKNQLAR